MGRFGLFDKTTEHTTAFLNRQWTLDDRLEHNDPFIFVLLSLGSQVKASVWRPQCEYKARILPSLCYIIKHRKSFICCAYEDFTFRKGILDVENANKSRHSMAVT